MIELFIYADIFHNQSRLILLPQIVHGASATKPYVFKWVQLHPLKILDIKYKNINIA